MDGDYGPATARAFNDYQEQKTQEREQLISRVQTSLDNNTTVQRARTEISNLQSRAASQVADAERAIQQLRERLNSNTGSNIETLIAQQNTRIQEASASVETLTDKKFDLESEYRQLEAEVGPLRYIAEFIYGDEAGTDLLEKAVQWVIVIIIFVFDPLAVLLLIASQYSLQAGHNYNRRKEDFMDTVTSKGDVAKPRNVRVVERRSSTKNVAEEPEQQKEEPQSAELSAEELDTSYDVSDEFIKSREEQYKEKEKDETFAKNKTDWKKENPNETLKHYKKLYTHGVIDSLPWE